MSQGRLAGKRTIITGAGSGMGRAAALRFALEGAKVGLIDNNEKNIADVAAEITAAGGESLTLAADVTDEEEVEAAVAEAVSRWGGLDTTVANAAIQLFGQDDRVDRLAADIWRKTIEVNLTGVFLA